MNDVSIFFAAGKRLSLDIKLHGIGFTKQSLDFEANSLVEWDETVRLVNMTDSIYQLLLCSCNEEIRKLGCSFKKDVDDQEYAHEIFYNISKLALLLSCIE